MFVPMRRPRIVSLVRVGLALGSGFLLLGASVTQGCGYDWSFPGKDDPAVEAGGFDAPILESSSPPDGNVGETQPPPPPPPPPPSGCRSSGECPDKSTYCRFADRQCGKSLEGTCEPIGMSCTAVDWRCGCQGTAYKNLCDQTAATRDDVSDTMGCTTPAGFFRCGYRFCPESTTFCLLKSGAAGTDYSCEGFDGCAAGDCTCSAVTKLACGAAACNDTKVGQVHLKCP